MRQLWRHIFRREEGRLSVMGLVIITSLTMLGSSLYRLQVEQSADFDASQEKQSLRLVEIPAVRGHIFDRNGTCLADSRPSFDAVIYLEELYGEWRSRELKERQEARRHGKRLEAHRHEQLLVEIVHERAAVLGQLLGLQPNLDDRQIRMHAAEQRPLPLILFPDLTPTALAIAKEHYPLPSGLDIEVNAVRRYPYNSLSAQLLGYVRRARPTLQTESVPTYSVPDDRGVSGLELKFDDELRGQAGMRTLLVNARGYKERELGCQPPLPGHDLLLSIDLHCQQAVEDAMGEHIGAAVVLDPRNGDVLALASTPSFDPNKFIPHIKKEDYDALAKDPAKPLINRAVSEQYAPGSTFKLVVALAGLDCGKLTPNSSAFCTGETLVGNQLKKCWIKGKGGQHGEVNLRSAIVHSCNIFFYQHGMDIGMASIVAMAKQFHFSELTHISLPHEAKGNLPILDGKHHYQPAETANIAIGQGAMDASPLQVACMVATIANGGNVISPRLVKSIHQPSASSGIGPVVEEFPSQSRGQLSIRPELLELVRKAMLGVVEDSDGTGKKAAVPGIHVAGKTGTAQVMDEHNNIKGHRAWFVTFAPYEAPRYAIAIMLEDGDSGGQTAAPIAGKIYASLFAADAAKHTSSVSLPPGPVLASTEGRPR